MPQVQVIQPIQQQPKRLRVAAYARVSSDSEDQLNSLSVQVDYYTHLIQENPNWDFAGIYADEGITGTSTKHREQFNRLMDDCRAGLIDRVLVKSASRFARNTADALASVREMKSLGVTVVFEKEGFDTETANGEMILSMICAVAQEESLSISKNLKWSIRKRMRDGTYLNGMSPFGYEKQESQLIPIEREAEIVRYIYNSFLVGAGTVQITEELNRRYPKENGTWYVSAVRRILMNEKYIGDIIRTLIWYDWEHGCSGCVPIDIVLLFDDFDEVGDFLKEWCKQKKKLKARKITRAKYLEWMLQWPTVKENN